MPIKKIKQFKDKHASLSLISFLKKLTRAALISNREINDNQAPKGLFKANVLIVILCVSLFFQVTAHANDLSQDIHFVWNKQKPVLQAQMEKRLNAGDSYVLYSIELNTNNLLKYAEKTRDIQILDDLARLYLTAIPYLILDKDGHKKWFFTDKNSKIALENPWLVGTEVKLYSCQFMFLVTSLINAVAHLEPQERTPAMTEFVAQFLPVAMKDHFPRWVAKDQVQLNGKLSGEIKVSEKHLKAVSDKEMFVVSGAVKLLAANAQDSILVSLSSQEKKIFLDFVGVGTRLLKSRLTETKLTDFNGRPVRGFNFDAGAWSEFADYDYAGYTGERYPGLADKSRVAGVGWDISHARRFVDVFDTLYDNRSVTGQSFPDDKIMKGLADQLAYGVFNRDFDKPLFTNFMDGTNGWYRVGYAGRKDFGFYPYRSSSAILTGGYGFWSRFQPDLCRIMLAFRNWMDRAERKQDPDFLKYYGQSFLQKDEGSSSLLEFLPTITC